MKKLFKSLFVMVLCVCTCLTFVGCGKTNWSDTTNDTTKVQSNGGISLYHDGWIYFVNGTKAVSEDVVDGKNVQAGIYRVETDAQGNVLYETTTETDEDGNEKEVKNFKTIEPVISKLVGYDDGSIFIFGNYLYYTTPCTDKNKDGSMLTGKIEFRRFDLVNKGDQLLYVTQASDDDVTFTYYKQLETLNLVVYEKTSKILTSLKIDTKVTENFKKTDVQSAIFSDRNGEVLETGNSLADLYVYYTLNFDEESNIKTGVRVYQVRPDGSKERKISEGKSITLLSVRAGHLIYSDADKRVYAEQISETTTLNPNVNNVVCYKNYENIIFLAEDEGVSALVYDNTSIRKLYWNNGVFTSETIETYDNGDKITFIGVDGDYVVYKLSSLVYKIKFNLAAGEENPIIKLSTTKIDDAKGFMAPEIVNGYVYGFYTDSSAKVTYMYRINLNLANDADAEAAEFIGVKE